MDEGAGFFLCIWDLDLIKGCRPSSFCVGRGGVRGVKGAREVIRRRSDEERGMVGIGRGLFLCIWDLDPCKGCRPSSFCVGVVVIKG